jgi:CubicO group peptidase (beta-lactamase class C family)
MMKSTRLTIFLIFLSLTAVYAQQKQVQIQRLMKRAGIPGLSLVYIKNGKVNEIYHIGLRSNDTKLPVDSETVFSAASLSKSVFAYGVLHLVEQGKLDLDKPLYQYYDYPDLKDEAYFHQLTARHVLSHTSGLPNWRNDGHLKFLRQPGKRFGYSGEGFVFLAKVVEKITGQDLESWMQQTVFKPLGMQRTSYVWQKAFDNDYAIPHIDIGLTDSRYFPANINSAASLQTTSIDYSKFLMALLNKQGLKGSTFKMLFQPQSNSQVDSAFKELSWGLGIGQQFSAAEHAFWQWGDNGTFKAYLIGYPDKKEGLVYFANSEAGLAIAKDLLSLFFNKPQPAINWLDQGATSLTEFEALNRLTSDYFNQAMAPFLQYGTNHQDTTLLPEAKMNFLGRRLIELKKTETAEQVFNMNLIAYPASSGAYAGLGEIQLRSGQRKLAQQSFLKAYDLDPRHPQTRELAKRLEADPIDQDAVKNGKLTIFKLPTYVSAKMVSLAGTFNNWDEMRNPMRWIDGAWTLVLDLKPGSYEYKFVVDGVWIPDPNNKKIKEGDFNSVIEVPNLQKEGPQKK